MEKFDRSFDIDGNKVKFGGLNLQDQIHALDLDKTDDEKNMWGNGSCLKKRPGLKMLYQVGTGGIYDIVRAMYGSGAILAEDSLFMLQSTSNIDKLRSWRIQSSYLDSSYADMTAGTGGYMDRRLIPAYDRIIVTASRNIGNYYQINPSGSNYILQSLGAGSCPSGLYSLGVRFKGQIFMFRSFTTTVDMHTTVYSGVNLPASWLAGDYNIMDAAGLTNCLTGGATDGERLYLSKATELWMITGATTETFRAEKISNLGGFLGIRSMGMTDDLMMGFFVESGASQPATSFGGKFEGYAARNIMAIKNGVAQLVGDTVMPLMKNIPYSSVYEPRVCYKKNDRLMIMIPDTSGPYVGNKRGAIIWDDCGKTWHYWEFYSYVANVPLSMCYAPGPSPTDPMRMYVGTNHGMLGYLSDSYAYDDQPGTGVTPGGQENIEAYWTSCWLNADNCENFKSPEYVFVQGAQVSGGNAELWMAYDYKPFVKVGDFPLLPDGACWTIANAKCRSVKVKIKLANDSVGGEIRRVALPQKVWGDR